MKRLVAAALVFALVLAPVGLQAAEKAKAPAKPVVKKTVVPGAKAPVFSVINAKGKVVKLKTLTDKEPKQRDVRTNCSHQPSTSSIFKKGARSLAIGCKSFMRLVNSSFSKP